MSAHTPGPWQWEWTDDYTAGFGMSAELHGGGKRLLYADVAGIVSGVKLTSDAGQAEAEANARLIATAPELYEALMSSVTFITKAAALGLLDADECAPLLAVYNAVLAKVDAP